MARTGENIYKRNVAALSELESHLCAAAPYGEDRYKAIVDAYTLSAAMRIAGW